MRRSRRSTPHLASVYAIALCSLTALVGHRAAAQGTASPPAFSVDDALNVVSYSQSNLSDDGRWLATVALSRRDGVGVDYRRDGDPTYVRPGAGMVWVIETATGKARALFPDKRNAKSLAWSPNGEQLAMLVLRNDAFQPMIWDRATGRLTTVTTPVGT